MKGQSEHCFCFVLTLEIGLAYLSQIKTNPKQTQTQTITEQGPFWWWLGGGGSGPRVVVNNETKQSQEKYLFKLHPGHHVPQAQLNK